MPRLPDVTDLGGRPTPVFRGRVASNPRAGVVGDALAGLGNQINRAGTQMVEKEDRLNYAKAEAELLKADVATRAELEKDQDYGTFATRYAERMAKAREQAASVIGSKSDRALFEAQAGVAFERGNAEVLKLANGKRVVAEKATLATGLESLRDTGRSALDDATRAATVNAANDLIVGAVEKGLLSPLEAVSAREGFASDYVYEQTQMMINREDYTGAQAYFALNRNMLDMERGLALEGRLKDALDFREADSVVDDIMGTATRDESEPVNYGDPLRGRGKGVSSAYGAKRGTSTHNGVDFPAAAGTPIHAIGAGKVISVGRDDRAGNHIIIEHADGTTSSYSHMQAPAGFKKGDTVTPDTVIGQVGTTGRSTGPHLHLVVKKNGQTIDPQKVIGTAQQAPREHDLTNIYTQIDARAAEEGWSPEKTERVKREADRRVSRDEMLLRRERDTAMQVALDRVDSLGDKFKDVSQIPNFNSLDPNDRIRLRGIAEANAKPASVVANGEAALSLGLMEIYEPDSFKGLDLRQYRGMMTPAEFEQLALRQAKARTEAPDAAGSSPRSAISTTIAFHAPDINLDPKKYKEAGTKERKEYLEIHKLMEAEVERETGGKRKATQAELDRAFANATMAVTVKDDGILFDSTKQVRRSSARALGIPAKVAVPADARARIISSYRQLRGVNPNQQQIAQEYLKYRGKPGFWK